MRRGVQLQIGFLFYRQFIWAAQLLNLAFFAGYLIGDKSIELMSKNILIKGFLWTACYFFYNHFLQQRYLFYFNLGVRKRFLWWSTIGFDAILLGFLFSLVYYAF